MIMKMLKSVYYIVFLNFLSADDICYYYYHAIMWQIHHYVWAMPKHVEFVTVLA